MPEKFFYSKYSLVVLMLLFLLLVVALGREGYFNYRTNQEIKRLQQQIDELQKNNSDAAEMEKYFQSQEFLEKEAKLKLNLVREGEKLIIVKQEENLPSGESAQNKTENISNIKKWWLYFFGT